MDDTIAIEIPIEEQASQEEGINIPKEVVSSMPNTEEKLVEEIKDGRDSERGIERSAH